jgi:hypothetical protein
MNYLSGYGSSDEETTPPPPKPTTSNVISAPIVPQTTKTVPKSKTEIFQALGLTNQLDLSETESEEEDLSGTVPEFEEIVEKPKTDKLIFRSKKQILAEKPELVSENPSMKEGTDFLLKFAKVIKGEHTSTFVSAPSAPIIQQDVAAPKFQQIDIVETNYENDDFEAGEEEIEIGEEDATETETIVIPQEIQREMKLKGVKIVDTAPQRSDREITEQKRKELMNRYKKEDEIPESRVFTDQEISQSQLSYLAHSSLKNAKKRDNEFGDKEAHKKAKREYGW